MLRWAISEQQLQSRGRAAPQPSTPHPHSGHGNLQNLHRLAASPEALPGGGSPISGTPPGSLRRSPSLHPLSPSSPQPLTANPPERGAAAVGLPNGRAATGGGGGGGGQRSPARRCRAGGRDAGSRSEPAELLLLLLLLLHSHHHLLLLLHRHHRRRRRSGAAAPRRGRGGGCRCSSWHMLQVSAQELPRRPPRAPAPPPHRAGAGLPAHARRGGVKPLPGRLPAPGG